MEILDIKNLSVIYKGKKKSSQLVDGISFSVKKGECLCILGESGSGKSMTMKAVMGLLDDNFEVSGEAVLEGENILGKDSEYLRKLRGSKMTMILQNPMTCFDSLYRIGYQIEETMKAHTEFSKKEIFEKSIKALEKMKIHNPAEVLEKYPHQLSGGMLQRIMIAIALMLEPKILVADEPTTAIDAITQFEVMKDFKRLKENHTTMVFITHDLGIASMIADKVVVLNKGKVVDRGTFKEIVENSKDPYTRLLIEKKKAVSEKYNKIVRGALHD